MLAVVLSLMISAAVFYLLKQEIDKSAAKQETTNTDYLSSLKKDLSTRLNTVQGTLEDNVRKNVMQMITPKFEDHVAKDIYDNTKILHERNIIKNRDNISSMLSNVDLISSNVNSNLTRVQDLDRSLQELTNSLDTLSSNVGILEMNTSNYLDNTNILELINQQITDFSASNGLGGGLSSGDLSGLTTRLDGIEGMMSNLDIGTISSNISMLDTQFATITNFDSALSNNIELIEDSKQALNKFFNITEGGGFTDQYKSSGGLGFKSWFDNTYNFGGNTANFQHFEDMVSKTDNMYSNQPSLLQRITDTETGITNVRSSIATINIGSDPSGNIINLGHIENILSSNASQIREMRNTLSDAVSQELEKLDGTQIANKLTGKNLTVNNIAMSEVRGDNVFTNNMSVAGNLNISGENIGDKIGVLESAVNQLVAGGVGGSNGSPVVLGSSLSYVTDNELASNLGIPNTDFIKQVSTSLSGSDIVNIPQKYVHSISGADGQVHFHEVDLASRTSNIHTLNAGIIGVSANDLITKIEGDTEASFNTGIRIGSNGCLRLNEEENDQPTLDLCDRNCSTNCRKIWDHRMAPHPN